MVFPFDKLSICTSSVKYSYVRFFNAAPCSDNIKIAINGVEMYKGLEYKAITGYDKAEKGVYRIVLSEDEKELIEKDITIDAEKIYTIAISDDNKNLKLDILDDIKQDKSSECAYTRFINLCCTTAPADIYLNRIKILSDIKQAEFSNYMTLTPGEYTIGANSHNSDKELTSVCWVNFECGKHYTVYLTGKEENPQILIPVEGTGYLSF